MPALAKPNEIREVRNYINGEFISGNGKELTVTSPYFGCTIATGKAASIDDINYAISSAASAQEEWGQLPLKERCQILFNFRSELVNELDSIAEVISLENGKTLAESKAGIKKGIEVLEFALSLQNLDLGGRMEVSRSVFCEYRREPLGVVANITPFNFPAMVPMWTIPIVIALGNAYVWKPSEKTPMTPARIAKCFANAGLPNGILTILNGERDVVENVIDHPEVKAVGFVGSTKIAKLVYERASHQGKRALALGGAKNHIILLPDADMELTGRGISDSFTGCAGQRCMAASVLLAVGDCEKHIENIKSRAEGMVLGDSMGAIITKEQVSYLSDAISRAEKAGAKILLDGRQAIIPADYKDGFWLGPTILDHISPGSEAAKVELFGPILSIIRCKSISEALKIQHSSEYGNACSVFTTSGPLAERVVSLAKAGMVGINIGVPVPREPFSFGGINASKFGHGDITGHSSLDFWTNSKKVTTKWESQSDENWMS